MRAASLVVATVVGAASSLAAGSAAAQSLPVKVFNDFKYAATDVFFLYTSPVRGDARDWATVGLAAGATGVTAIFDDEVDDWIANNPSSLPMEAIDPFREEGGTPLVDLGSGTNMIRLSGVLYLAGLVTGSDDLRDAGIGCAAAEKSQAAVRHGVYKLVSRERPLTANGDPFLIDVPGGPWEVHSFFGGHGANAMTCASFFVNRFELGLAEPVILGLAVGVGLGRVADRRHWLSDALVGGVFGYAVGKAFADRQLARVREREAKSAEGGRTGYRIEPLFGPTMDGAFVAGASVRF